MINPDEFYSELKKYNIDFFTGVPDSLLKDICGYITDNTPRNRNIIAANEGNAIGIASGYHFATNKIPMVYMQNSGIGNTVNPLLSLVDPDVYSIPMLIMVGWRGEPGIKDEPQHIKQGMVTPKLFEAMGIPYHILPKEINTAKDIITKSISYIKENNSPLVIIIQKGTFEPYKLKTLKKTTFELNREQAIKIIVDHLKDDDIIVSTTGKTSRELFEYRDELKQGHEKDFLTVGSMGHANQIALGIALEKPDRQVFCFDGDGALLMHTGSMGIIGDLTPKNYKHIVINNGAHESVGGQPTIAFNVDFSLIAKGFKYKEVFIADTKKSLKENIIKLINTDGPVMLEIKVNKGARENLGRPTLSPIENKNNFMNFLK